MKKVLIIDDEEDIREILAEFCEILGVVPIIATNGNEALQLFEREDVNLIISDIKMPDMDGFEFVNKIREKNKNIPIAICSGFIDEKNKKRIFQCGANYYLEKPFKLEQIKEIISNIL